MHKKFLALVIWFTTALPTNTPGSFNTESTKALPPAAPCSNILIPYNAATNPTAPQSNGLYVGNFYDGSDVYVGVIPQSAESIKAGCPVEDSYPARITTNGTNRGGSMECIVNDFDGTNLFYLQKDPNFIWVPTNNNIVTNVSNIVYYTNSIGLKFGYGRVFLKSTNGSTYVTVGKIHLNKYRPEIFFWSQNKRQSLTSNFDILACRYEVRSTPIPTTISTIKSSTTISTKAASISTTTTTIKTAISVPTLSTTMTTTRSTVPTSTFTFKTTAAAINSEPAVVPSFKTSTYVSESRGNDLGFPKELQDFRYNYLNNKGSYLKYIDGSFFEVYNALKGKLDSIANTYTHYNTSWALSYNNFNMSNLKKSNANHLKNLFADIDYLVTYSSKNVPSLMNNFYIALLGMESDPLIVAKTLWDIVEDHMNSISKFYCKNKACLVSSFNKYHPIYLRGINSIRATATTTISNMTTVFNKILSNADTTGKIMKTMANELNACNKIADPNDCVKSFIKNYDKFSEKLLEPISQSADKINDVKNFYENELAKAKDNLTTVEDDLEDWSQGVTKCIENSNIAVADSPILGNARVTTTKPSEKPLTTAKPTDKSETTIKTTKKAAHKG
ncbi:hypothetical protein PVAND_016655 [Polypedilum vanderplanki]|uniref:Uncharacterized protein n=1 Tax=Polypedilum vanderplanki TaxID=319348 RepID=A0A9J6BGE7_POLVA|nr:hypothetical protein PVAND_016655 [Polypedilum vanderplanki]